MKYQYLNFIALGLFAAFSSTTTLHAQFLSNGSSPYDALFGSGIYQKGSEHQLTVENQSDHDLIFCVVSVRTGRTIRNEYVRAHSDFTMTQIPEGLFYCKQVAGKGWDASAAVSGLDYGNFRWARVYSKSDEPEDYLDFRDENYWKNITVTIEAFEWQDGEAMDDIPIDESDFIL